MLPFVRVFENRPRLATALLCLLLAGCAGRPDDAVARRDRVCGEERQTARWHGCVADFLGQHPEMLGPAVTGVLSPFHREVANTLAPTEQGRMSQAAAREVIERLTDRMQGALPAAQAADRAFMAGRPRFCYPLPGGGNHCAGG